jgi:hypothetical protein
MRRELGIAEQRKADAYLLTKRAVALHRVFGDSEHDRTVLLKHSDGVAEIARFYGAPWGVVLRIEVENDPLTREV